eukprot:gene7235-8411_t
MGNQQSVPGGGQPGSNAQPASNLVLSIDTETVEISERYLVTLPLELQQLPKLKNLCLSRNKITKIDGVSRFATLEDLDLSYNSIQLLAVNLSFNKLPMEIGKLTQLLLLDLAENELRALPSQVGQLKMLTKLYLDNNDFLEIPDQIGNLVELKELNLRSNQLVDLPSALSRLTKLAIIDLEDNQWETEHYQSHNIAGLLQYLKSKRDVVNKSRRSTSKEYRRSLTRQKLEEKKRLSVDTVFEAEFRMVEAKRTLYRLQGCNRVFVRKVEPRAAAINNGDVFLLDTGRRIFVFFGASSNTRERLKGAHFAVALNTEGGGRADIVTLDNKTRREDQTEFWKELGGKVALDSHVTEDDDDEMEEEILMCTKLFRFSENDSHSIDIKVFVAETLYKTMLDSSSCAILDTGTDVFVWSGIYSSPNEKSWSMLKAEELMGHSRRSSSSDIHWVLDGFESVIFRENFVDWADNSWDPEIKLKEQTNNAQRDEMLRIEAEREQRRMEKEEREMAEQEALAAAAAATSVVSSPVVSKTQPPTVSSPSTPSLPEKSERELAKEREKEKIRERLKQRESSSPKLPIPEQPTKSLPAQPISTPVVPTSVPKVEVPKVEPKVEVKPTPVVVPKVEPKVEVAKPPAPAIVVQLPTTPKVEIPTPKVEPKVEVKPTPVVVPKVEPKVEVKPTPAPVAVKETPVTKITTPVVETKTVSVSAAPKTPVLPSGPSIIPEQAANFIAPLPEKTEMSKARKPASKNPIRARQERAALEEEQAKLRLADQSAPKVVNRAQVGGFGLLSTVGADDFSQFKQKREQQAEQGGISALINAAPKDQPKLLHIKGRRSPYVCQVELSYLSLNSGDCFILDCGKEMNLLFQWNGSSANRIEKGKGMDIAKSIKDKERVGCRVLIVEEGNESEEFWRVIGGKGPIPAAETAGDDRECELSIRRRFNLYKVIESSDPAQGIDLVVIEGRLSKNLLEGSECYLLDCISEMYVWTGSTSKLKLRTQSLKYANDLLEKRRANMIWVAAVHREFPGSEQVLFKERFPDWGGSLPIAVQQAPVGVNTASAKKQRKIDVATMLAPRAAKEEVMIDDGGGKVTVWRVEEFTKIVIDPSVHGQFYSGDSYIILYTYFYKNKDNYLIYFWQGKNSSINEKGTSALLTMELDDTLKGMAKEVRVVQNKEPRHFLSIFKGRLVVHAGKDPLGKGYKPPSPPLGHALYHVRGVSDVTTRAIQTKSSPHNLHSYNSFVLVPPVKSSPAFIWNGRMSNQLERAFSAKFVASLGMQSIVLEEDRETADFWTAIGGKGVHPLGDKAKRIEARLYSCSVGSGEFVVEEVPAAAQDDLLQEDVFIVDGIDHVWVWIGTDTAEIERRMSMEVSIEFAEALQAFDGRLNKPKSYITYSGKEPFIFTTLFHGWDFTKRKEANALTYDSEVVPTADILELYTKKYSYDDIVNKRYPKGIDGSRLEEYMSVEEFFKIFSMSLEEFQRLPLWRKQSLKKELQLY